MVGNKSDLVDTDSIDMTTTDKIVSLSNMDSHMFVSAKVILFHLVSQSINQSITDWLQRTKYASDSHTYSRRPAITGTTSYTG